jgi:hypothetical protein
MIYRIPGQNNLKGKKVMRQHRVVFFSPWSHDNKKILYVIFREKRVSADHSSTGSASFFEMAGD